MIVQNDVRILSVRVISCSLYTPSLVVGLIVAFKKPLSEVFTTGCVDEFVGRPARATVIHTIMLITCWLPSALEATSLPLGRDSFRRKPSGSRWTSLELFGKPVGSRGWTREQLWLTQRRLELSGVDVAEFPPAVCDGWLWTASSDIVCRDRRVIRYACSWRRRRWHRTRERWSLKPRRPVNCRRGSARVRTDSGRARWVRTPDRCRGAHCQRRGSPGQFRSPHSKMSQHSAPSDVLTSDSSSMNSGTEDIHCGRYTWMTAWVRGGSPTRTSCISNVVGWN